MRTRNAGTQYDVIISYSSFKLYAKYLYKTLRGSRDIISKTIGVICTL